jgi:hypothetical protein
MGALANSRIAHWAFVNEYGLREYDPPHSTVIKQKTPRAPSYGVDPSTPAAKQTSRYVHLSSFTTNASSNFSGLLTSIPT